MIKVLFISNGSALQPILYFQGISHFKVLQKKGVKYTLLSFEEKRKHMGKDEVYKIKELEKELLIHNIEWVRIPMSKFSLLPKWLTMNVLCLVYAIRIVAKRNIDVVHIRSYQVALIGIVLKYFFRVRFIFDMRGLLPEERVWCGLWKENGFGYRISKILEKLLIVKASCVVVVSRAFEKYIKNISLSTNVSVIPNCVDTDVFSFDSEIRESVRQKLGVGNKFVLIYSGSMQVWHSLPELLVFFVNFKEHMANAYFLILSYEHKNEINEEMTRRGVSSDDYSVMSVHPQDVPKYLQASDLAVILMNENIVTKVCSPTKFSQYLACGVPVVINDNIGDTREIVEKHRVGIIVNLNGAWEIEIKNILHFVYHNKKAQIRERCIHAAQRELSLGLAIDKYYDILLYADGR